MTDKERYDKARDAVKIAKDGSAFLQLGILYAKGKGTKENHVLANYFYEKAFTMGCQEAERYIEQEYELGCKNDVRIATEDICLLSPARQKRLKKQLEKERANKVYGNISSLRNQLDLFYPTYDRNKGFDDILNERDTLDADICYALSTSDNRSEIHIDTIDRILQQLYAPITNDKELLQRIIFSEDLDLITKDERELFQCIVNLSSSYNCVCDTYGLEKKELKTLSFIDSFPFIRMSTMALLRRQAFRCVLSVKDVVPAIQEEFLNKLDSDEDLLNICEKIPNQDLQLFLISFVELNIDSDTIEIDRQSMLNDYRNKNKDALASHLNECIHRLKEAGIEHQLPSFDSENLPQIDLDENNTDSAVNLEQNVKMEKDEHLTEKKSNGGTYSIFLNAEGEIMLTMTAREGEPENPRFIYDGRMALLYRNQESSVIFRNLEEEAREPLSKVDEILVVEIINDDVEREYMVPIRRVKDVEKLLID